MDCEKNPNDPICIEFYGTSPIQPLPMQIIPQLYIGPEATFMTTQATQAAQAASAVGTPWYKRWYVIAGLGLLGLGVIYKVTKRK